MNIQEAVDRVIHAGQAAVALHTQGRHGGPAEGIIVEPSGMVLVLAADMVHRVLHASRVQRARPQWTIQVYTPQRAWPFSTPAVLAVMWHLAPEDARRGTAEEIARDVHTSPADQDYPWRRPRGGLPVAPVAEGLSLTATLERHPDKRARHFLQTGTVPAARQTPSGDGTQGRRNHCPAPGSSRCGICPWAPWPTPLKPPRGLSCSRSSPVWPCSAACRRGRPGYGGRKEAGVEPLFPSGPGPGAAPCRGHGGRGMGGRRARHGVQVGHRGRPTAHAIAAGVPAPPTDAPLFGPPTRLYEGRTEGHTEPHQGVANEPGCTVPAGAGARTAGGPDTRGPPRLAQGVGPH